MAGPKRKIYRGGYQENHPEQMEYILDASGTTLPGHLLALNSDEEFVKHSGAAYLYIANVPPCFDPLSYQYEDGETAFGYVPRSRDVYLVRAVAGMTADKDAPLYSNGDGRVTATNPGGGALPVGYLHEAVSATSADDLVDMRIR